MEHIYGNKSLWNNIRIEFKIAFELHRLHAQFTALHVYQLTYGGV